MALTTNDLVTLLRNYTRLEQAAARMFRRWADDADDPEIRQTLLEFSEIEQQQAAAIALHLAELGGGKVTEGETPMEGAITSYLEQIDRLPTVGERLRFNHTVMSTLERPIVMRVLLSETGVKTQELFNRILENEDRILGWCDATATRLGVEDIDLERYYGDLMVIV